MNVKELQKILDLHQKWLEGDEDGQYADLSYTDLTCANLSRANLSRANLSHTNLHRADLTCANLSHTNLHCADLHRAFLHGANLDHARLIECVGDGRVIQSFMANPGTVVITKDVVCIHDQIFSTSVWLKLTTTDVLALLKANFDSLLETQNFVEVWKPVIDYTVNQFNEKKE